MKYSYTYEKFTLALNGMAMSPETLQNRIADAYLYHLMHVKVEELPDDICYRFENVKEKLTSVDPVGNEGRVKASVAQMSTDEAIEMAREIIYMADVVKSHYYAEMKKI